MSDAQQMDPVQKRIKQLLDEMRQLLQTEEGSPIKQRWRGEWAPALLRIIKERETRPQVEISLMGGTGAGKSTLVNALLDARILPVSNMRACTAAISEISYAPGSEYRARIQFVSRESWHKEISLLLEDVRDSRSAGDGDGDGDVVAIPRAAKDKLSAVYGPWESGELPSLDLADFQEPPEIARALDAGFEEIVTSTLSDFRKRIRDYLDSKCRFWPIVETVNVSGPFAALECGAKLVDLPGINDPNEAREAVTKAHLKRSRFVWIVFNIKRVLTKDVSNLMQSDDFVRQIVMDGREDALTFVGTASDDIDVDSACEEFDLDEDATLPEIAMARNSAVRQEVTGQVAELAARVARNAGSSERGDRLRDAFLGSKIFTLSARDYLALAGLAKNRPIFDDIDHTEIKQLREHMTRTCRNFGVEAQTRAHQARIDQVIHEIKAEVARGQSAIEQQRQITAGKRKELGGAIQRLAEFLDRDLEDCDERFAQELSSGQELLTERIKRAADRGDHDLDRVIDRWGQMHWCTLRAVARRGGRFISPTSGEHDFAVDVCRPILDGITFAWTDFFGDRLTNALTKWSDRLVAMAERYGIDVQKKLSALKLADDAKVQQDFKTVIETTQKVILEQLGQIQTEMTHRIGEVRRTLYEQIPEQVATDMKPAFLEAAEESGKGMKLRMIDKIATHAKRVSLDMFGDMEEQISRGVRSLNQWLRGKYGEMRKTIQRHAAIPAQNLLGRDDVSVEELDQRKDALTALADFLATLESSEPKE